MTDIDWHRELTADEFGDWYNDLLAMAIRHDMRWIISDKESHRNSFDEGLTPAEELTQLISYSR